jgi:hypothetical protein
MIWRYGLIEYRYDKDIETVGAMAGDVECACIIEVYNMDDEEGKPERMWGKASLSSDSSESMGRMLQMVTRDIARLNGQPDVICEGNKWWWADNPDKYYDMEDRWDDFFSER